MLIYAAFAMAFALSALIVFQAHRRVVPLPGRPQVRILGAYSPVLSWAYQQAILHRTKLFAGLELIAIGAWALWVGRKLLNFDPQVWPVGREFGIQVYGLHFWDLLLRCGTCSLWNGYLNGGGPYLADPFTGALHPVSALAAVLAGAVNGAKLTVLASMWMAGIGQWWIGKTIGLRRWSRLWAAFAAASGGHLIGRMELGAVALVLSTAATSLALAGAIDLAVHRSQRAALRLAVLLTLAILAGHGYLQLSLLLWAPWIALIALGQKAVGRPPWREFAVAGALAILMAGVLLVPLMHVWPSLDKFTDPLFETSQPFEYIPLNLVIHDWDYYLAGGLGSTAYPYLHTLFIGWPAVVLAAIGLLRVRKEDRRLLTALGLGAITMFWLASGTPFRWAVEVLPSIAGIRHVALMAGLAVPAVLALGGYGLDRLWDLVWSFPRPRLREHQVGGRWSFRAAYLMAIPLAAALGAADELDQHFLETYENSEAYRAIFVLRTPDLQWVAPPGGEHFWIEPGLAIDLKLTYAVTPFWWGDRQPAQPFLEAIRENPPTGPIPIDRLDDAPIFRYPENTYAYVETASGAFPCAAQGLGGDLTVRCESEGGNLVVRENAWDGWSARVNGEAVALGEGRWLTMTVPPGLVVIRLRYLPTDAVAGSLLSLIGLTATILLWRRERQRALRETPNKESHETQE